MMPSNAVTKLSYLIDMADWYCCEGCKHAETDGCAKEAAADASVYLEDGYLCCGLRERAEARAAAAGEKYTDWLWDVRIALESAFLPRTAAEVERVRRLEAVLEAAEEYRDAEQVQMLNEFKYDEPKYERQQRAKAALDAAIAAYREGEKC